MSRQRTLVKGLKQAGMMTGALFIALTLQPAAAEEHFSFADEAALADAMALLNENLAHNVAPPTPCRLHILNDLRGHELFDDGTFSLMHRALAAGILGAERVDDCTVESHAVVQNDVTGFLEDRRKSDDAGLALILTYYKLSEGVTVFASLRDAAGSILGSTGRFDLPVVAMKDTGEINLAQGNETNTTQVNERSPQKVSLAESPPTEPASATNQALAAVTEELQTTVDTALPEMELRRQLAAGARIAKTPSSPFNLRRLQAGVSSPIRTVRVVDTSGQDTALMTDLAESFLTTLALSSDSSVEANEAERISEPAADIEGIDIKISNIDTAVERMLNNEADILVTRQSISPAAAARFAETYGVNMRSHYAEHVVAITANETKPLECGLNYPEDDMFMITEDHPTSQRVYIYTNPSIPGAMRDQFIDFSLSAEGQVVVGEHAVDLRLQLSDPGYAAWRYQAAGQQGAELLNVLERFRGLIRTSQRVSSTFRFDFASADLVLDSRSEQDLENLIDLIKAKDIDSRRILLFGFADSIGAAPFNVGLSRSRADAVAIRLRLAGIPIPPRNVHGIGEDSPVACNLLSDGERDELGARKNRRVEVWIES